MQNTSRTSMLDSEIVAAWQEQIAAARQRPGLLPEIMRRRDELLPRFAAHYTYLRALPRRARRTLQRHWHLPLAGVALMMALGQSPAFAATIPVNASCSLIDAITAANTDTVTGGCPAGSGADTIVLPPGSTHTLTAVNNFTNDPYGPTGLPVISTVVTIVGNGSNIARAASAPEFRILAVNSTGDLTLNETTVSGGTIVPSFSVGSGVVNYGGTLTINDSIISGNYAAGLGGGVYNRYGTLTMTQSTISGNSAWFGGGVYNSYLGTVTLLNSIISSNSVSTLGGGLVNHGGNVTITNSTISGNSAGVYVGAMENLGTVSMINSTISGNSAYLNTGGVRNFGTLALARTLVTGNTAATAPEISNNFPYGTVLANNHNLFGVNGNAGVVGFTPGRTDIVPRRGIQLSNTLNPTLAFNGGPTQTHALVPGSPAIDAGGLACTDANGNPLLTDQRGKPRTIDGDGDGTARCDIGAFEFFPVVNNLVTLDPALDTSFNPTPVPNAPAGTFTIGATFINTSGTALRFPFFTVTELSGENLLLNAEEGPQGVGATVTPNVGDQVLSPGETVQVDFIVGLQTPEPFTFFVGLFGEPLLSGSSKSRQRPNVTTK